MYLGKECVFLKGKFYALFFEGGYRGGNRVYSMSYKVNNEIEMFFYLLLF